MFSLVSSQEKIDFTENLAVMLSSGITVNEALATLAEQTPSKIFRKSINRISNDIEAGSPVSEAFGKEERIFGSIYISLLRAGETSGTLDKSLLLLSDWLLRDDDLKKEIRRATLYPKIMVVATVLLSFGLATFILPRLVPMFESFQIDLPLPTKILLAVSVFMRDYWMLVFFCLVGAVTGFILLQKITPVKRIMDIVRIKLPFLGPLAADYEVAIFTQIFATLFHSGVSIGESLDIVRTAATNIIYRESIGKIYERVQTGVALSKAMGDYPALFSKNVINIIAVGEKTGHLGDSMQHLSEYYSKRINNKTKKLPIIIEPLLLIGIAVMVGFVAISIIMPIYKLTSGL